MAGELFSFRWHDDFWVPLFQFDPVLPTLRAQPRRVLDELRGVFDDWDIARWYVRGHDDLHGRRPLALSGAVWRRTHCRGQVEPRLLNRNTARHLSHRTERQTHGNRSWTSRHTALASRGQ